MNTLSKSKRQRIAGLLMAVYSIRYISEQLGVPQGAVMGIRRELVTAGIDLWDNRVCKRGPDALERIAKKRASARRRWGVPDGHKRLCGIDVSEEHYDVIQKTAYNLRYRTGSLEIAQEFIRGYLLEAGTGGKTGVHAKGNLTAAKTVVEVIASPPPPPTPEPDPPPLVVEPPQPIESIDFRVPAEFNHHEEQRLRELSAIEAFVAKKGVSREVDWGPHKKAVEFLRGIGQDVVKLSLYRRYTTRPDKMWLINGGWHCTTTELYRRVNEEREIRKLKPLTLPDQSMIGERGKTREGAQVGV